MRKYSEIFGWLGLLCIQIATIPTIIKGIYGNSVILPSLDMVIFIWVGIVLYLIRNIINKDILYIASNLINLTTQSILLVLVILKSK